jgi:hypothetical protein
VAGGHQTDPNTDSVYSGVQGIQLIVFLAELNALEVWGADIGNAYLRTLTKEKVYIIGGKFLWRVCSTSSAECFSTNYEYFIHDTYMLNNNNTTNMTKTINQRCFFLNRLLLLRSLKSTETLREYQS